MRLQKYLADAGVASRRASEKLIEAGRVTVNGAVATVGCTVEPGADEILLDGKPVRQETERVVALLYKPRGVVSTSDDPEGRKTVQAYFTDIPQRLFNVGRLDVNSEGLIIMTNDGALAYRLTHPKFCVEKTYYAVVDGALSASEIAQLTNGVLLEDGMTAPARIAHVRATQNGDTSLSITIHEGRNRQIRRMAEAVGHRTLRLKREQFGPLTVGEMRPGERRILTKAEMAELDRLLDAANARNGK